MIDQRIRKGIIHPREKLLTNKQKKKKNSKLKKLYIKYFLVLNKFNNKYKLSIPGFTYASSIFRNLINLICNLINLNRIFLLPAVESPIVHRCVALRSSANHCASFPKSYF